MESKYSDFAEKNQTLQEKIEAFTSGILSPETKAITLWAMESGRFYGHKELYTEVKSFSGGYLPITHNPIWAYCNGNPGRSEGSLFSIGAVVKNEAEIMDTAVGPLVRILYAKTPAGDDFGDAIAARALYISKKLSSKNKSMLKIFGNANKPKKAKTRRGYAVYKVMKFLSENYGKVYREADLEEHIGLPHGVICYTLNSLGQSGVIDYDSPNREMGGKKREGWAEYRLVNNKLFGESIDSLYHKIQEKKWFKNKGWLESVIKYIKYNPNEVYSCQSIPRKLKIEKGFVSRILSFLDEIGYLEADFGTTKRIHSKANANENTVLIFRNLLEPIEVVAERLEPRDYKGFFDPLNYYNHYIDKRVEEIKNMLRIYNRERNLRGVQSSEEIDSILLHLPNKPLKLSQITEIVNSRNTKLNYMTILNHLNGLIESKHFDRIKRGIYKRIN